MVNRSVLVVDLCGGLAALACLTVGGWYGWLNPDASGPMLDTMQATVNHQQAELVRARGRLTQQEVILQETRAEAESRGQLPSTTALEKDLGAIVALAQRHRLTVQQVSPLPAVNYPGILEQRYSIDARGSFADWIAFLRAFEGDEFWVDITHVRLASDRATGTTESAPTAQMILSFFSAVQEVGRGAKT
ncbi:MAG: hypothetical protein IID37_09050 [Planctomycetes bacterium]|nr:hypothetical protein [Planctomycetota bacterium]